MAEKVIEQIIFKNTKWEQLVWELFRWNMFNNNVVVMCHWSWGSMHFPIYEEMASQLKNNLVPYFRFDLSGHWESEWKREELTISKWVDDLICAIDSIKNKWFQNIILFAKSKWWVIALRAAVKLDNVAGMVLVAPWNKEEDYEDLYKTIYGFDKPVLLLHWTDDKLVPVSITKDLYQNLIDAERIVLDWADHDFSHPRDFKKIISYSLDFIFNNMRS